MLRSVQRVVRAVVAAGVLAVSLLAVAPAATAAPYPPPVTGSISVSTTTPFLGETITVTGSGFTVRTRIRLVFFSTPVTLADVTTSGSGTFRIAVTIPRTAAVGNHLLRAYQGNTLVDEVGLTVSAAPAGGGSGGGGIGNGSGGGLPNTGVAVLGAGVTALALLAAGAVFVVAGRRRRDESA